LDDHELSDTGSVHVPFTFDLHLVSTMFIASFRRITFAWWWTSWTIREPVDDIIPI